MQHYIEINRRIVSYNAQNRSKASLPYLTLSISCKRMHTHTHILCALVASFTIHPSLSFISLVLFLSLTHSPSLYISFFFSLSLIHYLFIYSSIIKSNISYARKAYNKRLQSNYTKSKACNIRLDSV